MRQSGPGGRGWFGKRPNVAGCPGRRRNRRRFSTHSSITTLPGGRGRCFQRWSRFWMRFRRMVISWRWSRISTTGFTASWTIWNSGQGSPPSSTQPMPARESLIPAFSTMPSHGSINGQARLSTSGIPPKRIARGLKMWESAPSCWIGPASRFSMPWNGFEVVSQENDLANPVSGSYPGARQTRFIHARIAQSVEQLAFNQLVLGSSPSPRTFIFSGSSRSRFSIGHPNSGGFFVVCNEASLPFDCCHAAG